jgi:hypothetical protein
MSDIPGIWWSVHFIKRKRFDVFTVLLPAGSPLLALPGVRCVPGQPYDTLAGLILFELGHLPAEGEQVPWGNYLLTCDKVKGTAIRKVRIEQVEQQKYQED